MREESTIRIDIGGDGIKQIFVTANSAEARDAAIDRLRTALPAIELLESSLQAEIPEQK